MDLFWKVILQLSMHDFCAYSTNQKGLAEEREKRNLLQFSRMIKKMTGRNALAYNNYGCWCGSGGGGKVLDGVDRCCKIHDLCYIRIERRGCHPKWSTYRYRIMGGVIICRSKRFCLKEACMCDKRAAECFRRNKYNKRNKRVKRIKRCFGVVPKPHPGHGFVTHVPNIFNVTTIPSIAIH